MKCWNDFTKKMHDFPNTPTLHSLRSPGKYWIVSDAQLKRDLAPRTLATVYKEGCTKFLGWDHNAPARTEDGDRKRYLAWCRSKSHTPSPASLDWNLYSDKATKGDLPTEAEYRMAA